MAPSRIRQTSSDTAVKARLRWAEQHLGYCFNTPALLDQALTHRSASRQNNERLEFLGDALLNFVVARRLYERSHTDSEGDLSRLRAALVKGETLADVGRELDLEPRVIVGTGELRSGGARLSSVLANTLEAIIGAILLDGGFAQAEACVDRLMESRLKTLPDAASLKDAKSKLQEWLQGRSLGLPQYTVESTTGDPHERTFSVVCEVTKKQVVTTGQGTSRRSAEQAAAQQMLLMLTGDDE